MIKTKVNLTNDEDGMRFPLLAQSNDLKSVVLFNNETTGVCLAKGNGTIEVGAIHDWISVYSSFWRVFPKGATITLEQE